MTHHTFYKRQRPRGAHDVVNSGLNNSSVVVKTKDGADDDSIRE